MSSEIVRVLLVDSDRKRCTALAASLGKSERPAFRVLPVWESLAAAVVKLRAHAFDVVLLDLDHRDTEGMEGLVAIRDAAPDVSVVVLAEKAVDEDVVTALKLGAADYLLRDDVHPGVVIRVTRYAALRGQALTRERRAELRYRQLFRNSLDAVVVTDTGGLVLDANAAALELLGIPDPSLAASDLLDSAVDPGERDRLHSILRLEEPVAGRELRLTGSDGTVHTCMLSTAVHHETEDDAAVRHVILRDITERKVMEERLAHDALHDPLTGLPNRALLNDRLERAVARLEREPDRIFAVLFIDLDRFKRVNDRFGHEAGDEVLRRIAGALADVVRTQDTLARMGGDEFAVLLENAGINEARQAAERMLERLREPVRLMGGAVTVGASIGITTSAEGEVDAATLLRDADTAMYRAKSTGRGRCQVFDLAMRAEVDRAFTLEAELRRALEGDQLAVFYQPIHDATNGSIRGFEALARWRHPERGMLPPSGFIRFAEETGLIVDLGEVIFRRACEEMTSWPAGNGAPRPFVTVNLSAKQFIQPDLVERMESILAATGADPRRLRLELTESTLMSNAQRAIETLRRLRELGLEIWIDDFGTGYSSLAYLQRFPVSAVKIERSFVAGLEGGEGEGYGEELVRTVVSLADALGLETVAEGVETRRQLQRVRDLGVVAVQGFLLSRPEERPDLSAAGAGSEGFFGS